MLDLVLTIALQSNPSPTPRDFNNPRPSRLPSPFIGVPATTATGTDCTDKMGSEIKTAEQRLKSFTGQLQTECGILERLVYKHKNQHRRSSYFQYILKVRRDLKLLKLTNLDEVLDSSFLVINGDRPKQKVQLLEGLKRRKCNGGKYNFLERLLGVTRLLSQMVEPLLKAAIEISMLLARSFFMKFSLAVLAVLARIRVLVQQMLLDAVLLYNTVSSLSQKEQSIKLKQEGFEVFREYYPRKEEARVFLECIWQNDKFVLVEKTNKSESTSQDKDGQGDFSLSSQKILYENIEVFLGVDESEAVASAHPTADTIHVQENCSDAGDENNVAEASEIAQPSTANIVSSEDVSTNPSAGIFSERNSSKLVGDDDTCSLKTSESKGTHLETLSYRSKRETKKKVAFVAVKQPATNQSNLHLKGTERINDREDPFFNLLTGGNKSSLL